MQKILAFCFFPAFMPAQSGGVSRLFNLYQALSEQTEVTLITSTHLEGPAERIYHGANFVEIRVPKDQYFAQHWKKMAAYAGKGDMSAPTLAAAGQSPTLMHEVYLQEYPKADLIIHDFPFMVDYDLFLGLDQKPRIYNAHNCETELYKKLHEGNQAAPIHELVKRCEQKLLNHADAVWYCSADDLSAFQALAPEASFEAIFAPNGLSLLPLARSTTVKTKQAVFMGSSHLPNAEAALWIVQHLAPALPDWHFNFIGTCLDVDTAVGKNVTVHGLVEADGKQQLLQEATVAINPMQSGSGSNVKVFDYFAHGTAVLSTPMGLRGIDAIDGKQVYVAELAQFKAQLEAIAAQPELCQQIAQQGWQWAREHYSWQAIAAPLLAQIQKMCAVANSTPTPQRILALNDYDSYANIGGGCVRTQGLYQAVAEHYPVVLLCFSTNQKLAVRQVAPSVHVFEIPKTAAHLRQEDQDNSRCSPISVNDIIASQQLTSNPWMHTVYMQLASSAYAIVAEHVYMVPLPLWAKHRFIYSSHNHEGDLKKRLLPKRAQDLVQYVEALEKQAVAIAICTLAVSDSDAMLLSQTASAGPIFVVPNGALPPADALPEHMEQVKLMTDTKLQAVFLGSGHPPNAEAALFIVNKLAPACPEVQFHLVGSVCGAINASPQNVSCWGVVDEGLKTAILSQANIALNPVISGSGSNIKLADFMGNGLYTLSTPFGVRGYSSEITEHYQLADIEQFATVLNKLRISDIDTPALRQQRRALFDSYLSMYAQGQIFVRYLQQINKPRKRVLFVTYRYTSPTQGGAEQFFEQLVQATDAHGDYLVDVIAPQVSALRPEHRFREDYLWESSTQALTDVQRTRFQRFAVDGNDADFWTDDLAALWRVQPAFERLLYQQLAQQQALPTQQAALAWGWGHVENSLTGKPQRWALADCAVHVPANSRLSLQGEAIDGTVLTVFDALEQRIAEQPLKGKFSLHFSGLAAGAVRFFSSVPKGVVPDPRPLAFRLLSLQINDEAMDLRAQPLCGVSELPAATGFKLMDQASRARSHQALTNVRGPWSSGLERYLAEHMHQYDAVVTHNIVFRPAVAAVQYAHQAGIPSLIVPHAHLDDDYYHFPDLIKTIQQASVVFASPKAACDFYENKGANTEYLPAGIDSSEAFSAADSSAFDAAYAASGLSAAQTALPFVLVLGRKSGAKGYQQVIEAVSLLEGKARVLLIGPDDDGVLINSSHATYLGRQPREVVRGALQQCLALVTMSRSESFGIVLLEAWLAAKPVIANTHCAAFHDMAKHEENALLVDDKPQVVAQAIERLLGDSAFAKQLGEQGHTITAQYDWVAVGQQFLQKLDAITAG